VRSGLREEEGEKVKREAGRKYFLLKFMCLKGLKNSKKFRFFASVFDPLHR